MIVERVEQYEPDYSLGYEQDRKLIKQLTEFIENVPGVAAHHYQLYTIYRKTMKSDGSWYLYGLLHNDYIFPHETTNEEMVRVVEADGQVFQAALEASDLHLRIKEFAIMAYGQTAEDLEDNPCSGYFIQSFVTR